MTIFLSLFAVQALLGALDNLLHHELTEKLPARASARRELALHSARELIYAVVFVVLAWLSPHGLWAWALLALLLIEIVITIADFLEEDRTRTLPPFERALHTALALIFGALLALGAPLWAHWAAQPTDLVGAHRGLFSYFFTLCAAGVAAWGVRNFIASAGLFAKAHSFPQANPRASGRTVLITGATGFLGEALTRRRLAGGDSVIVLSRDPRRAEALFDGRVLAVRDLSLVPASTRIDAIVNLSGAGVASAPWTRGRKRVLMESRLGAIDSIRRLIDRLETKPKTLVAASAVGFYGDRGEQTLTENSPRGAGFTGDSCEAVEEAARRTAQGVRVVLLRFGLVLGRDGGGWPMMTLPLRLGLGAVFGNGRQFMAWIHKEDALRFIEAALEDERLSGPVNAVAPQETRHGDVMRAAADALGGRLLLPVPAPLLRAGLGEMAHLFLDSQRVVPRAAAASGFSFAFPTIDSAACDLLTPGVHSTRGTDGAAANPSPLWGRWPLRSSGRMGGNTDLVG